MTAKPGELIALTGDCHDLTPGPGSTRPAATHIKPRGHLRAVLNWAEPWFGVETDIDLYVVDSNGVLVTYSATSNSGEISAPYPGEYAYIRTAARKRRPTA